MNEWIYYYYYLFIFYIIFLRKIVLWIPFQVRKYSAKPDEDVDDDDSEAVAPQSVAFWGTVSEAFGNADESQLPPGDDEKVQRPYL